ncbi:LexA family transcriptional regulator [Microvirga sp. VF16]|uniref:LexA family protein n=1 Tax=Microvirga sp. VF16 TaxID=2807101 RepID=UPI001FEE64E9|nr:S24 family peptidase [Microvirga sp. VF16]
MGACGRRDGSDSSDGSRALCAGFPSPADDYLDGGLDFPLWLVPNPPATVAWRVSGSSMIEAGILDGDIALIDRSLRPRNTSVVAVVNGEPSLKRVSRIQGRLFLTFENRDLPPYELPDLADVTIWGVIARTMVPTAGLTG